MDAQMEFLNTATVRITPEILSLIAEVDNFKDAWRAIGRIAPERLSGLRRVATIESVGSSTRIDGARLTDREVEKLLANIRLGSFIRDKPVSCPRELIDCDWDGCHPDKLQGVGFVQRSRCLVPAFDGLDRS